MKENKLKIQITKHSKSGTVKMYPTPRKMIFFVNNKAETELKKGVRIDIKVRYKEGGTNEINNCSLKDLKWAYIAFVKEYL